MHKNVKENFFILTGGPGSGKSSVLKMLEDIGFKTASEVGRKIIKEQITAGGNITHTGDKVAFRDLMLHYSINDFNQYLNEHSIIFFDRGIPDLIGYSKLISEPVSKGLSTAIQMYRYNSTAFIFPPWKAIYAHDEERKQDFQEAIKTYECIKKGYVGSGYQLVELPKVSISDRANFILDHIKGLLDE